MAKKYYLIGIGGISMSSLAVFLKLQNNEVAGSDIVESENLKLIKSFAISYNIGHEEKNIKEFNPDCVVINYAISEDNEELKWAKLNRKKVISRAELLGKISKKFKHVIAISGTHGKTTTTALISEIFVASGLSPTVHVGGIMKFNNSNFLVGKNKFFITEACEYKNSFLSLTPELGIVLNIELDHLDFFKNLKDIKESFKSFLSQSKVKIVGSEGYSYMLISENESGENRVVYEARNIKKHCSGYSFEVDENNKLISRFYTNLLGEHNVKNALVAIIVALFYKVKLKVISKTLKNFHGIKRRFEKLGKINDVLIVHDYAHHPTEIKKAIAQAKNYGKVLTVFQPHTFSRTKKLHASFLKAFDETEGLILFKTYPSREKEENGVSAYDLFVSLQKNKNIFSYLSYSDNFDDAKLQIMRNIRNYDCVLILGAGDINNLGKEIFDT